jgi:alpha-tubulin suppressor-like RCC1 family protein
MTRRTARWPVCVGHPAALLAALSLVACVGELPTVADAEVTPPPRLAGGGVSTVEVTVGATLSPITLATIEGGTEPLAIVGDPLDIGLRLTSGLTLSLVGNTLQLSGTPSAPGGRIVQEQIVIEDDAQVEGTPGARTGRRLPISISLVINAPTAATTAPDADREATVGRPLPAGFRPVTRTAGSGTAPYSWSITPTLPSGLTLGADGTLSGTPSSAVASTLYTVTVADRYNSRASGTMRLAVNAPPALTPLDSVRVFTANVALPAAGVPLAALTGGTAPFTATLSPDASTLGGLAFDAATLSLRGTPQTPVAPRSHTITVTDANGATASATVTLGVRAPVSATVQRGALAWTAGRALPAGATAVQPVRGSGGAGALTYTVTPALPSGVSLDPSTGVLLGTPTQSAAQTSYTVTVRETINGVPTGAQASAGFTLRINAVPQLAGADSVRCDLATSCTEALAAVSGGTAPFTWTIASGVLPPGLSLNAATGRLQGSATRSADVTLLVRATDSTGASAQRSVRLVVPFAWSDVSAGVYHTCALSAEGEAFCWGNNFYNQLGMGDASVANNELVPRRVQTTATTSTWRQIRAGWDFSCGVTTAGAAFCWGRGEEGRLGDGDVINRDRPTAVAVGSGRFAQLALGWRHACGIRSDSGETQCWGINSDGQVGNGAPESTVLRPATVAGGLVLNSVGLGGGVSCGVSSSAFGFCWGSNNLGQLGNGMTGTSRTPSNVSLPAGVQWAQISPNGDHTCALTTTGQLYCWGANNLSQRGLLPSGAVSTPQLLPIAGQSFKRVATGFQFTCALSLTNAVYCWGRNDIGQLGIGVTSTSETPRLVPLPSDTYVNIVAGAFHVCVLSARGAMLCWGNNLDGQLGRGSTEPSPVPASPVLPSAGASVQGAAWRALPRGDTCATAAAGGASAGPPLSACASRGGRW